MVVETVISDELSLYNESVLNNGQGPGQGWCDSHSFLKPVWINFTSIDTTGATGTLLETGFYFKEGEMVENIFVFLSKDITGAGSTDLISVGTDKGGVGDDSKFGSALTSAIGNTKMLLPYEVSASITDLTYFGVPVVAKGDDPEQLIITIAKACVGSVRVCITRSAQ